MEHLSWLWAPFGEVCWIGFDEKYFESDFDFGCRNPGRHHGFRGPCLEVGWNLFLYLAEELRLEEILPMEKRLM